MKKIITILKIMLFATIMIFLSNDNIYAQGGNGGGGNGGGGNGNGNGGGHQPPTETAGNNLSFPVIFADGGSKVLPGTMGAYTLEGEWWYVWGEDPIDPQAPLFSCKPSTTNPDKCENNTDPGDGNSTVYRAYVQKDAKNVWQAHNSSVPPGETLYINWVDWGDNLESVAWTLNSKVRTEMVLYQDIDSVTQFSMRHVDSWGTDEVHGLQTTLNKEPIYGPGTQATVFTPNARLTIQKLNYTSSSIDPSRLIWVPGTGWTEAENETVDIINEPLLHQAVSEAGDGPEFFSAEINVKGKIMYGYIWDLKTLNQGEGYYRLTFSFDEGDEAIGTVKFDEFTQIIVSEEEEETTEVTEITAIEEGPGAGGVGIMDYTNNLTYIDVLIGDNGGEDLTWVAVTGLELIDAENDISLGALTDGMQINMNEISVANLSVEAITTNDVGSVNFQLSGESSTSRIENAVPYTLYGHNNGDYSGNSFAKGNYTLTVTPYAEKFLTGEAGTPITVSFEVVAAPPDGETAGNNLSFPVIFADGGLKALPGTMENYSLNGEWWYVWGEDPIDPQAPINSCRPAESNTSKCENGAFPGDGVSPVFKAFIQKDINNVWQAYNTSVPDGETMTIDWVDWGDNLESLAWGIDSKVRTELVLLKDLDEPVTQFAMRHVDGWGTNEVHGLQTEMNNQPVMGEGTQATVYSPKVRFIVQKLNYTRESIPASRLTWDPEMKKWIETLPEYEDIINDPIFNQAAFEAGTGSGYFSAEINVKGKIMYGYTWDVNSINQGEGHYRLTYSFDEGDGVSGRAILDPTTQIVLPIEEETATIVNTTKLLEEPSDGGVAILDPVNNLTYMDVLIGQPGEALLSDHNYEMDTFALYPNPTENGMVNIKTTTGNQLKIYNVVGHEVFSTKINGSNDVQTLNLSGLRPGLYFVRISDNVNTSVKKLIIR